MCCKKCTFAAVRPVVNDNGRATQKTIKRHKCQLLSANIETIVGDEDDGGVFSKHDTTFSLGNARNF